MVYRKLSCFIMTYSGTTEQVATERNGINADCVNLAISGDVKLNILELHQKLLLIIVNINNILVSTARRQSTELFVDNRNENFCEETMCSSQKFNVATRFAFTYQYVYTKNQRESEDPFEMAEQYFEQAKGLSLEAQLRILVYYKFLISQKNFSPENQRTKEGVRNQLDNLNIYEFLPGFFDFWNSFFPKK